MNATERENRAKPRFEEADADRVRSAARAIYDARIGGKLIDDIPHEYTPRDLDEAYAVQARLLEMLNEPTVGWMLAFTNEKMRKMYNANEPYFARVLRQNHYLSPARLEIKYKMPMIFECEVVFLMGRDLPPGDQPYTIEDVSDAVEAMLPSIEIPISNFRKPFELPLSTVIAANGVDGPLITGPAVRDWRKLDRSNLPILLSVNGEIRTEGRSSEAMGDPLKALTWLANELRKSGKSLRKGEIINTGVCGDPIECRFGDEVVGSFGDLGEVKASIIDARDSSMGP